MVAIMTVAFVRSGRHTRQSRARALQPPPNTHGRFSRIIDVYPCETWRSPPALSTCAPAQLGDAGNSPGSQGYCCQVSSFVCAAIRAGLFDGLATRHATLSRHLGLPAF